MILISLFALLAGYGEISVGITGNWAGILTTPLRPSISTAVVGSFYALGGLALLTRKKWGLWLGIGFIGAEVVGRFYLMAVGIAPSHGADFLKILVGATIAVAVIIYLLFKRDYFRD